MLWRFLILLSVLCADVMGAWAQAPRGEKPLSNLRKKYIPTKPATVALDSLSIIPNTVSVVGVADSLYTIDYINAKLTWHQRPAWDSVMIRYRVFPTRLNGTVKRMVYDSVMNNFLSGQPFTPDYGDNTRNASFFNFGNISYNGSFGRGISFGNTQDAVVTSNLNLQLNGYLADSIEISAAITDNNIPIQPDGTTQELNEFDRIFLQFKKRNWALSLGDIDIRQQQSYFLTFYKRLQGVAFETTSQISKRVSNTSMVSGSIAKGKFTRNVFEGQEGNQGPYRLQGANNEFFFIVLANTERVFIDGELLQRGEDQDYVINYNTAEIAFTPKRMITKDSRIQVEFEYADRNYLNANLYLSDEVNFNNKVKLRANFFNNSDAKNSPINQTLDPAQKRFLDSIGDNINQAFYPNAVIDTFSTGKILYKKIDTVFNAGTHDSIFIYSTSADSARYSLSFIDVGQGNGSYVPDFNGANGKVYRWVEPLNGINQGRFEPAIFLVTPKKQQVMSVGVDYAISSNTQVTAEAATSVYDVNTFSAKDKANDRGYAAKFQFKNTIPFHSKKGRKLTSELGYEYVDHQFKPLERLRNVEFTRDWGLPLITNPTDETIVTAALQLTSTNNGLLRYQFTDYHRAEGFNGVRNALYQVMDSKRWRFNNALVLSDIKSVTDKGYFFRPNIDITRRFPGLRNYSIKAGYSLEHNEIRRKATDTLTSQSFSFQTFQFALLSDQAKANHWSLTYFTRTDQYPVATKLVGADRSQNVNFTVELLKSEHHQIRFNTTYRELKILKEGITGQKPDNSLLSRAEYVINEWKGLITGNVLYETGAGQEQRRDLAYIEVPAGQGEYTWIDYNNDGVQQLNEFEVALFQDQAKFIRIFTPTNEFVKANYNTFNYSLSLNPRAAINLAEASWLKKFTARLNFQSSLQVSKKELSDGNLQLNPFKTSIGDTSLITLTSVFINTFSFNRFSSRWGFDVNSVNNGSKALLTYGYESHELKEWGIKGRWNFSRALLLEVSGRSGINRLTSSNPKFDNRNYNIAQLSTEPAISFTHKANFRLLVGYRYSDKENRQGSMERSKTNSLNTEVKYNILQSTSLIGKFTYSSISFKSNDATANTNSPAAYIMLDGLLPGKNFLWTLDLTRRLSNNLEINIQYEGRKPGTARIVHIGRASIRALL